MDDTGEVAPAVASILDAARDRPGSDDRLAVDARPLVAALAAARAAGRVPLIAEIKPTSPTTEAERTADPVDLANDMVAGGAAALSVLTEPAHFGGSPDALRAVRQAVDVPVLRKDFILTEDQLDVVPADVVLLIARFLGTDRADSLDDLVRAARDRGFQVIVEVHSEAELRRAVEAGAAVIGVNNRDLARLEVDLATFERIAPSAPAAVTLIAESGISTPADVQRMCRAGADGLLVGSAIMAGDPTETTRQLVTAVPEETLT